MSIIVERAGQFIPQQLYHEADGWRVNPDESLDIISKTYGTRGDHWPVEIVVVATYPPGGWQRVLRNDPPPGTIHVGTKETP